MTKNICFKIGVENGRLLYYTKEFESFEELIKYVKGKINKYGHDMFSCNLIVQAFKDNSFNFDNACFMQETIPFRCLKVDTIEQMIGDLVKKNWGKIMTDKQQIEDMALELYNNQDKIDVTNPYEVAELIYNTNYRKVPENAVVLTEEEYNALMLEQKRLKEIVDRIPCGYELKDKTRKETADKIFDILYQWLDLEQIEKYGFVTIQKFDFLRKFREIFKQFGVEVEQ